MLSATDKTFMLSVLMLSVVLLNVVKLSVFMLSVFMLSVMMSVVALTQVLYLLHYRLWPDLCNMSVRRNPIEELSLLKAAGC